MTAAKKNTAYRTPLALTSPHMRGPRVKDAQWLLSGHNAWSDKDNPISTYHGRIDSEYGPATASAVKQAKYLLGYPGEQIDQTFGQLVFNLLHGDAHLSEEYAANRTRRLKQLNKPQSRKAKAIEIARKEIGTQESPFGSNRQKYGRWYGMDGVPWCAIFVSWSLNQAGVKGWKYSYVPTILDDARHNRNWMSLTYQPERGDLVVYTLHGNPDCHVAFFDEWENDKHFGFYDLGGNTGATDFSNGGEVLRQLRNLMMVHHFVKLGF